MIKRIRMLYSEVIETISEFFTSDDYTFSYGKSDRFPSVLNVVFQRLLKYLHIVFPVGYILVVILNYETGDSILGLLFGGLVVAVFYCILLVVALLALMFIESFAKILASLIMFNEMPQGAENPPDALLMAIVTRKF